MGGICTITTEGRESLHVQSSTLLAEKVSWAKPSFAVASLAQRGLLKRGLWGDGGLGLGLARLRDVESGKEV
jgi:hypothetical protein